MSTSTQNFSSEKSVAILALIDELAADSLRFTRIDVMAATGLGESAAGGYIRHLLDANAIHCVQEATWAQRGRAPKEYASGRMPVIDMDAVAVDDFPRRVVVRQQWAPNHVRGPMECLLFGVPAALQESAA